MNDETTLTTTTTHAIPAYLKPHAAVGTEHLTQDDVQMPRLVLAQAMSDQVNATRKLPDMQSDAHD